MKSAKLSKIKTAAIYKKLILFFFLAVIVTLGLIIYFSLSKTIITVTLNPQEVSTSFNIKITADESTTENSNSSLSGYLVATELTKTKQFQIEEKGEEVPAPATGTVTIYNNWSKEQPLAATTRLLTPAGILFRIKERVDVPAGGKVENVEVYADQPGPSGNIGPTTFTIPGLWQGLQDKIYAESTSPMTGGLRTITIITEEEVNKARKELINELIPEAKAKLEQQEQVQQHQDTIMEETLIPITLSLTSSPEIGEEANSFELTATIRYIATVFDHNELLSLALQHLKKELPQDEQIESYHPDDLSFTIEKFDLEAQYALLNVTFTAAAVPRYSNPIFNRDNLIRKDKQEIKAYFSNFDSIGTVEVKFSPFWVSKTPSLKDHIEIKIQK